MSTKRKRESKTILYGLFPIILALAWLFFTFMTVQANRDFEKEPKQQGNAEAFLPFVSKSFASPVGDYYCYEYEFGLIWTTEIITLNVDGNSLYGLENGAYVITGTWEYTASQQEVGFTNFRWLTATYEIPNRLWNRAYLEDAGFEIAINCYRREPR